MISRLFSLITLTFAFTLLPACGGGDHKDHKDHTHKDHDHGDHKDHDHDHDDHGHVHTAPRGGTLVELGDHAANVELLIDSDRKVFALYALDAHAENAAKIAQADVEITLLSSKLGTKEKPAEDFTITLAAVANENTGEKIGDTSQFQVGLDALKGLTQFEGVIKTITIKGATYNDVKFKLKPKSK